MDSLCKIKLEERVFLLCITSTFGKTRIPVDRRVDIQTCKQTCADTYRCWHTDGRYIDGLKKGSRRHQILTNQLRATFVKCMIEGNAHSLKFRLSVLLLSIVYCVLSYVCMRSSSDNVVRCGTVSTGY